MTLIKNAKEHIQCINYETDNTPLIEIKRLRAGQQWRLFNRFDSLAFVTKGSGKVSINGSEFTKFGDSKAFSLLANYDFSIQSITEMEIIIVRIYGREQLCACYPLESLAQTFQDEKSDVINEYRDGNSPYFLRIERKLMTILNQMSECIESGLKCRVYFDLKVKEILYLLRAFYAKKDLNMLLEPILSSDISFSSYIVQNHHKYRTVSDLAQSMNCSVSTLEKKFKMVFGTHVYGWMMDRKLRKILLSIAENEKAFKEIALEYGFSSQAYFSGFCKTHLGYSPKEVRQMIIDNRQSIETIIANAPYVNKGKIEM